MLPLFFHALPFVIRSRVRRCECGVAFFFVLSLDCVFLLSPPCLLAFCAGRAWTFLRPGQGGRGFTSHGPVIERPGSVSLLWYFLFLFCSVLSFRCPDSHCVSIGAIPALVSLYASSSTSSSHRYLQGSLATALPLWLLNMRCAPPVLAVRRLLSLFFYSTIHFQRSTRRLMNAQTHTHTVCLLSHSLASLYPLCHASSICGATQKLAARGTCVSCELPIDGNTTAVAVAPAAAATVCIRGLRSNRQNNATTHKTAG